MPKNFVFLVFLETIEKTAKKNFKTDRALLNCPKKKSLKKIASEILKIVDQLYSFTFNY